MQTEQKVDGVVDSAHFWPVCGQWWPIPYSTSNPANKTSTSLDWAEFGHL